MKSHKQKNVLNVNDRDKACLPCPNLLVKENLLLYNGGTIWILSKDMLRK